LQTLQFYIALCTTIYAWSRDKITQKATAIAMCAWMTEVNIVLCIWWIVSHKYPMLLSLIFAGTLGLMFTAYCDWTPCEPPEAGSYELRNSPLRYIHYYCIFIVCIVLLAMLAYNGIESFNHPLLVLLYIVTIFHAIFAVSGMCIFTVDRLTKLLVSTVASVVSFVLAAIVSGTALVTMLAIFGLSHGIGVIYEASKYGSNMEVH